MQEENKSVCKVIVAAGKECGNKFPTNLHMHLEKNHTEAYQALEQKEKEKKMHQLKKAKKAHSPKSPMSITSCLLGAKPYDKGSL